ncbi:MAG TPA: L-rhamnose/proton symporter RhaT [Acidobacteriota bacterium]|nr:L-rhamnose/proton symporter RhaT [Acidobacteriota bacterium]
MVTENLTLGLVLVLLGGLLQGSFMLPMKYTREWKWENVWLVFSATAYLILPWLIAYLTVPRLGDVLSGTSSRTLVQTIALGLGWGVGALTFGLGVDYLGLALGFAIILGLTAAIGTLVPLLVLSPESLGGTPGLMILIGIAIIIAGISVCSWAGNLKEQALAGGGRSVTGNEPRSYALGLLFCILSGILSPFGNLGFAFGSEVSEVALAMGTSEHYAANPLWALLTLPLFFCNAGFSLYLLSRSGAFSRFSTAPAHYYLLAASMGAMWIGGMATYGSGANKLGEAGASVGWAILMSSMVIFANLWGVLTGEWAGAGKKPLRVMGLGVFLLIIAIFVIGFSRA